MTAKEKANELGNKFYQGSIFDYNNEEHKVEVKNAKERAKICANEIHDVVKSDFWLEVIKEIDLL